MTSPKKPENTSEDLLPPIPETDADDFAERDASLIDPKAEPGLLDDEIDESDLPEEDDDNPMQESDQALPDDVEESILRHNPGKEGGRFDEV